MKFIFYSPIHFERWDWTNSIEKGIGGSETSHVEMAWRLAKNGHDVVSYAPVPWEGIQQWRGTTWKPFEDVDCTEPGIWIIYRCPEFSTRLTLPDQQVWLMCQDWDYEISEEAFTCIDRIMVLSNAHKDWLLKRKPHWAEKMMVTSNGIKLDLIAEVEKNQPERNPLRIMYASSPDRGLLPLLKIVTRAQEYVPDLELHTYYGFDNIDKMPHLGLKKLKKEIMAYDGKPGINFHGRVSQLELYSEWLKAGIWCYPSNFWETSCITCMEAQALGAVPLINPVWAQGENTHHGLVISGDPESDLLTQARFSAELVRLSSQTLQGMIRPAMMGKARATFGWEHFVEQWENEARKTHYRNDSLHGRITGTA